MAALPDPTAQLTDEDRSALEGMAAVRARAEGRRSLGQVYVLMFHNPPVTRAVGALGEQLRFHGVLPDRTRELVILRFAARKRLSYEWAHHQHPARLAGLDDGSIEALLGDAAPSALTGDDRAVVEAVDAVTEAVGIPAEVQERVVSAYGYDGVVEIVALCGLYGLIGAMVTSFDIPLEEGIPPAPF